MSLAMTKSRGDGLLACKSCNMRNNDRITIASFVDVSLRTNETMYNDDVDNAAARSEDFEIISNKGLCRFCNIEVEESLKKPEQNETHRISN